MQAKLQGQDAIRDFVTGGHALFTVKNTRTGIRFTYKVTAKRDEEGRISTPYFVKVLTGPNNTADYTYLGYARSDAPYRHGGSKSTIGSNAPSSTAFEWFWRHLMDPQAKPLTAYPELECWHEGRCCRCGRKLTTPESVASGIGPVCEGRD